VPSLSRPGGNVTGSAWLTGKEVGGKWVELLKQAAPRIVRVVHLGDPRIQTNQSLTPEAAQAAADTLGVVLTVYQARRPWGGSARRAARPRACWCRTRGWRWPARLPDDRGPSGADVEPGQPAARL